MSVKIITEKGTLNCNGLFFHVFGKESPLKGVYSVDNPQSMSLDFTGVVVSSTNTFESFISQ